MSKKYKFIFCAVGFALVAIIAGLCFIFFGNKNIDSVPNFIEVQKIDGDFCLVTEFNSEFSYQFKLEQLIDEQYLTIEYVNSDVNTLKLENCKLNFEAGGTFRFSARYTNGNGRGKSEFGESVVWSPNLSLGEVDYSKVGFAEDILSWEAVVDADLYSIVAVDENLQSFEFTSETTAYSLSNLKAGVWTIYVIAKSSKNYLNPSEQGVGKQIIIERKNVISDAQLVDENNLTLSCSQEVEKFEVYVDDSLVGTLLAEESDNGSYNFSNCAMLFKNVDFSVCEIKIKSLKVGCILESEMTSVSVMF